MKFETYIDEDNVLLRVFENTKGKLCIAIYENDLNNPTAVFTCGKKDAVQVSKDVLKIAKQLEEDD